MNNLFFWAFFLAGAAINAMVWEEIGNMRMFGEIMQTLFFVAAGIFMGLDD